MDDVRLQCPITIPPMILAIGLNYRLHAEETGSNLPKVPLVFTKQQTCAKYSDNNRRQVVSVIVLSYLSTTNQNICLSFQIKHFLYNARPNDILNLFFYLTCGSLLVACWSVH